MITVICNTVIVTLSSRAPIFQKYDVVYPGVVEVLSAQPVSAL